MKFLLACLAVAVVVVFAEDLFYYEPATWEMLHRFNHECFVMVLTEDQHNDVMNNIGIVELQTLMRQLQTMANSTSWVDPATTSEFVQHHCHSKPTYQLTP